MTVKLEACQEFDTGEIFVRATVHNCETKIVARATFYGPYAQRNAEQFAKGWTH